MLGLLPVSLAFITELRIARVNETFEYLCLVYWYIWLEVCIPRVAVCETVTVVNAKMAKQKDRKTTIFYLSFQKAGVKMMRTENISRRPISMRNEHIHLAKSGR